MGNNQHSSIFKPIIIIGLIFLNLAVYAQTYNYPNSTATSSSSSGVTNPNFAAGTDMTNAARLTSSLLSNNRFVQITWPAASIAANTPVYIKVQTETTLLSGLLGGNLGELVTDLSSLLVDGQAITLTAQLGTSNSNSVTINGSFNNESSSTTKVIQDAAGDTYIRFVPTQAFNNITITNTRLGLVGTLSSKYLDVYGAYYLTSVPSCTMAQYTGYTGGGLLSADITAGAGSQFGYRAIDSSVSTYSTLSVGTAGVGAYAEQQFYFVGTNSASDTYNVRLAIPPSILQLGLLQAAEIRWYNGNTYISGTTVYSLLTADLLTLLQSGQTANINVSPGVAITKIGVRLVGLANATVTQQMNIYSVNKSSFTLTATANHTDGNYFVGETATLTATATGCSTYSYSWSNSLGSTASVTAPTATPGSTTYTVTATDTFGNTKTATVTVNVLQPPVGGNLSGAGFVCYNTQPGDLTVTGYTGSIIRWERSINSDFSGATTIANTTATLTSAEIGILTQTTYIRAVIANNGYAYNAYATATLTVKTTTWNGVSWSNGVPDINTMIFFTGDYSEDVDLYGCAIQVNNGANVSIPAENTVTLQYNITVNSGTMTYENNAHILQNEETSSNVGNVNIRRNSSSLFRLDYTLWSAPVTGQNLLDFSPATLADRFYEYKYDYSQTQAQYVEAYFHVDAETTDFEVGKGYLIRMPNADDTTGYNGGTEDIIFEGNFTGVPNNGTYQRPLSVQGARFTAIGNPYPSPINVQAFFDANQSVLQNGSALYFWRKKNNTNATSYATLTRDTYISNPATGGNAGENQYGGEVWDDFFNNEVDPADWVINPAQGFLVQTSSSLSSANATFTNSMRRNVHNNQFFRQAPDGTAGNSTYFLDIRSSVDVSRMAVVHSSTATTGIDQFRDARKIMDANLINLYSVAENQNLVVQARPFAENDVVKIGYKTNTARQYTISLSRVTGIFANGQNIYLKDNVEGITRNITNNSYTFTTEAGTFNNRFEIIYSTTTLDTDVPETMVNNVVVYKNNGIITVDAGTTQINRIQVYDINGRTLYDKNNVNNVTGSVDGLTAQTQVVMVKVETIKGTVTKKVVF